MLCLVKKLKHQEKQMKLPSSLLTGVALAGMLTVWDVPLKAVNPSLVQASAAEMKDSTGLTAGQKIDLVMKNKGQFGGGDQLRRFFFGDLEPLGVQPGGAGMVVNLYNKANNVTFAYCSTYDVVVAVKQGKISRFEASEVK
ncbi:hypothetical protein DSM107003_35590 [Trichormus variabilis SAG 1403-4b]|uniref:Uncharacterized protein n=2 Tax=Anabaena variabilis TaxID=264691 RepID=A0A433UM20_ANAVA|nr:hypothetical protein DSM107003_35590 [Trichormus variabilis SAG 1403-4b]